MSRLIDPLLQAVFDAPGDDRLREVVADAFMEQGDLRGEFITMQLALARGEATPLTASRAHELERRYGRGWAALPTVSRVDFKRGFPWIVETAETHDRAEWATVGVLILPAVHALARFLSSSRWLSSLERLSCVDTATLRACSAANLPSLRAVDLSHELELVALEHLATFPNVTELSCSAVAPFTALLHRSDLLSNLRHLRLRVFLGDALELSALAEAVAASAQLLVSVETYLGVTFQFGPERVLKVLFISEDLAVSLSDQALETVRVNVPSTFRQFEFLCAGESANELVPDDLRRWLR